MTGRRVTYLLILAGAFIFAVAYQKWMAWFLFVTLLALPLFSLLVSLPAMLSARFRLRLPAAVTLGHTLEPEVFYRCILPMPMWQFRMVVEQPLTGQHWRLKDYDSLPAEHCGTLSVTVRKARIFDYLGLFKVPMRLHERCYRTIVRPMPVPVPNLPPLDNCIHRNWKPKPGGGFSENHELRLYRPGDNIQQIHWKLSAKTGSLILREPMEPVRGRVLLRMDLKGTAQELDTKLGQLLWLGQTLLEKDIHFQIQCLTGKGLELWEVTSAEALTCAMDAILSRPQATDGSLIHRAESAVWQCFIGGDGHETA